MMACDGLTVEFGAPDLFPAFDVDARLDEMTEPTPLALASVSCASGRFVLRKQPAVP